MGDNVYSLYIHIPFCKSKCNYCDFLSFDGIDDYVQRTYIDSLLMELQFYREYLSNIKTIYIGGGTPTSLNSEIFARLLKVVNDIIHGLEFYEFTVEANPESFDEHKADLIKEYNINRISIGVQSFSDIILKKLNRIARRDDIYRAVEILKSRGFNNYNLDLMIGVQDKKTFSDDIDRILSLNPKHISMYILQLSRYTPLYNLVKSGKYEIMEDHEMSSIYLHGCKVLEYNSYNHYEISNFAIEGYESLHNLNYWKYGDYIGIGIGAVSKVNNKRWKNKSNLKIYINEINKGNKPIQNVENLDESTIFKERMMLSLRTNLGFNCDEIAEKIGKEKRKSFFEYLKLLKNEGLLKIKGRTINLTNRGFLISNEIIAEIFSFLE